LNSPTVVRRHSVKILASHAGRVDMHRHGGKLRERVQQRMLDLLPDRVAGRS
jgi:hypothetical protein